MFVVFHSQFSMESEDLLWLDHWNYFELDRIHFIHFLLLFISIVFHWDGRVSTCFFHTIQDTLQYTQSPCPGRCPGSDYVAAHSNRSISRYDDKVWRTQSHWNPLIIYKYIVEFCRFFEQASNTFGIFVLSKLIAFGLEAACSIFQLDMVSGACNSVSPSQNIIILAPITFVSFKFQQHQNARSENFIYLFVLLFNLLSLFVYCYHGDKSSECLEEIADLFYGFEWYTQNIKVRKMVVMLIANAQRPRHFHGFGVILLTLDTFTNVSIQHHAIPYHDWLQCISRG